MFRCFLQPNLSIVEASVDDLVVRHDGSGAGGAPSVGGVVVDGGDVIRSDAVVLTTGTFLRGVVHIGKEQYPAGRHQRTADDAVEPPSVGPP